MQYGIIALRDFPGLDTWSVAVLYGDGGLPVSRWGDAAPPPRDHRRRSMGLFNVDKQQRRFRTLNNIYFMASILDLDGAFGSLGHV